jgi:hypothetical protein
LHLKQIKTIYYVLWLNVNIIIVLVNYLLTRRGVINLNLDFIKKILFNYFKKNSVNLLDDQIYILLVMFIVI